jgi:hypothetical protein
VTTLVERLGLPAALPPARSRRDTETDTVQFAQAALAAAKGLLGNNLVTFSNAPVRSCV